MLPSKTINIRIPPHLAERFDALRERFGGLPPSTIVRFMISDLLERSLEEQAEIVNRQIQKPKGAKGDGKKKREPLNAKNRIAGE